MKLDISTWKEFALIDIFGEAKRGTRITTSDRIEGNIPFVTAGEQNNGISDFISNKETITYNNAITIDMFGNAFYHSYDFKCDDNILVITNNYLNSLNGNFIATIIMQDKYKCNYGRQYRKEDYKEHKIKLPIDNKGNPDWQFMEDYMKSLNHRTLTTKNAKSNIPELNVSEWKEFKLGKLFEIKNGQKYPSDIRESGNLPLVSTSAENNGISDYIAPRTDHVYSNFLTVAYSGSVGATFYHCQNVFVGETVFALLPMFKMTMHSGVFIATIMNFENYKYSYGRKIVGSKYGSTTIKLPICKNPNGEPVIDCTYKYSEEGYIPDFQFMEDYIKSLPFGDKII